MLKQDKPAVVDNLENKLKSAKSVTVFDYQGMPNSELTNLRQKISQVGGVFLVAKNTLLKRAFSAFDKELNIELNGPTAIVFAQEDEIAPIQVMGKSISETQLPKLKFGIFFGNMLDEVSLKRLSQLPSREVLYTKLLGALIAPKYGLVGILNANLQKLVTILDQRRKAVS